MEETKVIEQAQTQKSEMISLCESLCRNLIDVESYEITRSESNKALYITHVEGDVFFGSTLESIINVIRACNLSYYLFIDNHIHNDNKLKLRIY